MLRIEEPLYFYLLLAIPLVALVFYLYFQYARRMEGYFSIPDEMRKIYRRDNTRSFYYFSLGLVFLTLALTNPQYGYRKERVERESADVYVAVDISKSMMAEDLSPSRLERAKKIGERLIRELKTERIGLILFAGEAYLQMPLTTDYRSAIIFLRNASTDQAGVQGTAIADAIAMAAKRDEDDFENRNRIVVVISDGEDHEGRAADAAKEAVQSGTAVFTVGVGTVDGGFIPVSHGGQNDYLRDKSGQPVRSRMNSNDLKEVADRGGGLYFDHNVGATMYQEIKDKVNRLERRQYEKTLFTARESYYQWLLLPGLLLMALPFLLRIFQVAKEKKLTNLNKLG